MYEAFYGFTEKPFNITPDPKFLFLSPKHQEAISHLLYGIQERGGFIVITGEIGTGKTILCRYLLNQLDEHTEGAVILNPNLSELELLKAINEDFGIRSTATTKKTLIDELNAFLLKRRLAGKNMVLVIDEAQNLAPAVLEQIRLLSNLETEKEKLIQIILLGQPELRTLLGRQDLRQLNQRVTARYHLTPLSRKEMVAYVRHRMGVGGNATAAAFTGGALAGIYGFSNGTPRLINVICDRLLLAGFAANTKRITGAMVRQAVREVAGDALQPPLHRRRAFQLTAAAAVALLCASAGWGANALWNRTGSRAERAEQVAANPAASASAAQIEPTRQPAPVARVEAPVPATAAAVRAPNETQPAAAQAAVSAPAAPVQATPPPGPAPAPKTVEAPTKIDPPAPQPYVPQPVKETTPAQVATPVTAAPAASQVEPTHTSSEPAGRVVRPAPPADRQVARAPASTPPLASVERAEEERRLISSLFEPSGSRVLARAPAVIEETLPPEPGMPVGSPELRPTPAPGPSLRLTRAAEVARLVEGLQPFDSRVAAGQALFRLWGRHFEPPKEAGAPEFMDFYKMALDQGMRCSEIWANFDTLRKINLPGVLEVFSPNSPTSRYVVLAAIHDDGTGTLLWGPDASARVNLDALDECWRRRTFFFWQDHEPVGEVVSDGARGDHVVWIQESLRQLGYYAGDTTGLYDPATRQAVLQFQQAFQLTPDGVVGPRTRMVLYSRLPRYATPHLAAVGKGDPREHHSQGTEETTG